MALAVTRQQGFRGEMWAVYTDTELLTPIIETVRCNSMNSIDITVTKLPTLHYNIRYRKRRSIIGINCIKHLNTQQINKQTANKHIHK